MFYGEAAPTWLFADGKYTGTSILRKFVEKGYDQFALSRPVDGKAVADLSV